MGRYYYLILLLAPILFSISLMDSVYAGHEFVRAPAVTPVPQSVSGDETSKQINELKAEIEFFKEELNAANERSTIFVIVVIVIAGLSFFAAWHIAKRNEDRVIQTMIDITNDGYRISKVTSGRGVRREDDKVVADLVQVVGGKRIVAEKQKSHTTSNVVAKPKKQSKNNNEDHVNPKSG